MIGRLQPFVRQRWRRPNSTPAMSVSPYFHGVRITRARAAAQRSAAVVSTKQRTRKHVNIEYETAAKRDSDTSGKSGSEQVIAPKRPRKIGATAQWEPSRWRDQLANIREMRKSRDAPVDTRGCEMAPDRSEPPEVRTKYCCRLCCLPVEYLDPG